MKKKVQYIKISPADFVNPPYIKCPKCGKNTFGVLIIAAENYCRRCASCYYPTPQKGESSVSFPLPKLNKKVIYIDQMAISNMMFSLNPKAKAYAKVKNIPFWKELFEKLDKLCKLQLIICPDSSFHKYESLMSPYYKALERMYELLSHGVSFYDNQIIARFQIIGQLMIYLGKKKELDLDVHRITHGRINEWQDRFLIKANFQDDPKLIDEIRDTRDKTSDAVLPIFKRWQSEKGKDFHYWYDEEKKAAAKGLIEAYVHYLQKYTLMSYGKIPLQAEELFPTPAVTTMHAIKERLKEHGVKQENLNAELGKFLRSDFFENTPCYKISAMLYAAMARKAAYGMKKPPSKGFMNDVSIISSLLLYCDAMFIDNECRGFLNENPLKQELAYKTKVFSYNNHKDFLSYLDEIHSEASKEHLSKIAEVYGENWGSPFLALYQ